MSVFKFTDAARVGWKAAKRPSCSYSSCPLPTASYRELLVATARMRSARRDGESTTHRPIAWQEGQPSVEQFLIMSSERVPPATINR